MTKFIKNISLQYLLKIIMLLFCISVMGGCESIRPPRLQPTPFSFRFTPEDQNASLVAFSLDCKADHDFYASLYVDDTKGKKSIWRKDTFEIPLYCGGNSYAGVKIFVLPAGSYRLGAIGWGEPPYNFYAEGNHFYFNLKAHTLTYLGEIHYLIVGSKVEMAITNESTKDLPVIKFDVTNISSHDYILVNWKQSGVKDYVAK